MTKSDFRATKSLAADLMRLEESIKRNQKELDVSFSNVKTRVSSLENLGNPIEYRDSITSLTSSIQDNIDNLDDDMTGLDGLDLFDFKNSPDDIVINLRKSSDYLKNFDIKVENCIKLIIKAKGNEQFKDDIEESTKDVESSVKGIDSSLSEISSSLKLLLEEISHFKAHSKDLLQNKIY